MKAIVLLSGGLDSATCLYEALDQGYNAIALSFRYSQRHSIELEKAASLAEKSNIEEHIIFDLDFSSFGGSALTANINVPKGGERLGEEGYIPITYVPARNLIFLSVATALAESREAEAIFIGINALDYSGYPDCRPDFIESFAQTSALGTKKGREGQPVELHTPLVRMTKAEIVAQASSLNVPLEETWSCYDPQVKGESYVPCQECDACLLRAKGFREAGIEDPTF